MNAPSSRSSAATPSPAAHLRGVHVGVRDDLEVTRHLFRGAAAYVVRDPVTFHSHRMEPEDYDILIRIQAQRPLGEIFDELCAAGKIRREDEEPFYQFVMELHRMGFLRLPIADDKLLYRRYQAKERARRRAQWTGILFLRVPLWNPNAFLDRTIRLARPLFGRTAFLLWMALMVVAGYVLWARREDLKEPLQGLLAAQNLLLMWLTLIVLKTFHEFGHAYACKHFGGHVPEMGAYFILFTPCAYVDATACWGFPRTRDRVIVCLAGMYVESILAAMAVFVWALTGPSLINSVAYNAMFLAGMVTVLFNINPLMRYDGYYVLSDLLGIPNLRARANAFLLVMAKRLFLGLPVSDREPGWRLRATLIAFGVAATLYRMVLLFAIAAVLASKLYVAGIGVAIAYLAKTIFGAAAKLMNYLWHAEETAAVRAHAVAIGVLALVVLPAAAVSVPLPTRVYARGVITSERETPVHALQAGFVNAVHVRPGAEVWGGAHLLDLHNDALDAAIAQVQAQIDAAQTRRDAFRLNEPTRAHQEEQRLAALQATLAQRKQRKAELQIAAPASGRLISILRPRDCGLFLSEGTAVGVIAAGDWRVKTILDEAEYVRAAPRVGDHAEFRTYGTGQRTLTGHIVEVAPAGSRAINLLSLTQLAGGKVVVDPHTHQARQPYFEVTIALPEAQGLHHGITGYVRLFGVAEPIATRLTHRITRFLDKLARE